MSSSYIIGSGTEEVVDNTFNTKLQSSEDSDVFKSGESVRRSIRKKDSLPANPDLTEVAVFTHNRKNSNLTKQLTLIQIPLTNIWTRVTRRTKFPRRTSLGKMIFM